MNKSVPTTTNNQRSKTSPCLRRRAFTMVELLVTITIIGIIAGMSLGALQWARRYAAEEKTKATIAKIDSIIMRRYDEYRTRRMPITIPPGTSPVNAAWMKLDALRDMMRMELPDCAHDIVNLPFPFSWEPGGQPQANTRDTALRRFYLQNPPWDSNGAADDYQNAQCLYLIVSSKPDDLAQFSQNEIGGVTDPTGRNHPVFVDGWGTPIMFLRWAPGLIPPTATATLQTGDALNDHDPFDPRRVDSTAYRLVPLIYSAGPDKIMGLNIAHVFDPAGHLYTCYGVQSDVGAPDTNNAAGRVDNITNHQTETN